MRFHDFLKRSQGTAAVEFAFVGPVFIAAMLLVIESGLVLWTQIGMEHAVESAARCAAIDTTICSNAGATQTYAASQAYGLNLPASNFVYSKSSCGDLVTASHTYYFISKAYPAASLALNAKACFPS